jgi:hypothetical protein
MLAIHFRGGDRYLPSKFTKAVVVVICIQEVPSLNLAQVINYYLELDFLWFSSVPPSQYQDSVSNLAIAASFHILSKYLFINHPTI